ncbi:MAG: radical SAM family heme chaperone HemW [Gammaproteobacteria bacterium]
MSNDLGVTPTTLLALPPLSLYVHIPWCVRKCPYCDFNSHEKTTELPEQAYIDALLQDFASSVPFIQGRPLHSIFFGGGTPSLFSAQGFDRLLRGINQKIQFATDIEITLEANPGTAERQKFADYKRVGINRLSIGIQSFDDLQLQALGRIHGSDDATKAVEFAHAAGFDNFNIDIMYGLKGQNTAAAMRDLNTAIALSPTHLSWYQLTIEPNTEFYKRPPVLPEDDALIDIQDSGFALLQSHAYSRYEISAFAQAGRQARHNLNYWRFGDYIGIGAGAHGKITQAHTQQIVRTRKKKQPDHYLADPQLKPANTSPIALDEVAIEYLLNVLRLPEGFTAAHFEGSTGLGFEAIEKQVSSLQTQGLMQVDGPLIRPTEKGQQFLNSVLEAFL